MALVYLGLGANVGDRLKSIACAIASLADFPNSCLVRVSPLYETEPWGVKEQAAFLNCVVVLDTGLQPGMLFKSSQKIEHHLGRKRSIPWGPRSIDIDVILYSDRIIDEEGLIVPHPRLVERRFVLTPLADVAGGMIVPGLNRTVESLLNTCTDQGNVKMIDAFFEMNWRSQL